MENNNVELIARLVMEAIDKKESTSNGFMV